MNVRRLFFLAILFVLPALACSLPGREEDPTATPTQVPPTATTPPTPTADPAANFTEYTSEGTGLTFRYPAGWAVDDSFFIAVASEAALLEEGADRMDEGAVIILLAGDEADFEGDDPSSILSASLTDFEIGTEQTIVEGPTATQIQGQNAAVISFTGLGGESTPFVGRGAAISNGGRVGIAFGITPTASEAQYLGTLEAILNTIVVGEPSAVPEIPTVLPEQTPTPNATLGAEERVLIATGEVRSDAVVEGDAVDYVFEGTAGETVTIVVDPADDLDIVLEVLSEIDASSLRSTDDGFSGEPESLVFTPPADGEYLIRVRGFAGAGGNFDISVMAGGEAEPVAEAIPLALQISYDGVLEAEQVDYILAAPADVTLVAVLQPLDDQDLVLGAYDALGNQLSEVDLGFSGESEVLVLTTPATGDFVFRVSAFGAGGGPYSLIVLDPELSFSVTGNIIGGGPANFRMCVPAESAVVAVVMPVGELDATLDLLGPGGGNLVNQQDRGFGGEPETIFYTEGASSSVPYAVIASVGGFGGADGDFVLIVGSTVTEEVVRDGC